ncbi:MAG TPA: helix-turn-helix transcriptional regulator [Alphaproteobacteria bacterium]|jgi:phage repressor protein C with HTH and peptisase S24 domain
MLKHDDIWRALDALASSRGFSPSGLARRAGLDATSFNPSKRVALNGKPRWPSTESLSKALAAADCSLAEFLGLMGEDGPPRHIPLLALGKAGREGAFDDSGAPRPDGWEEIELPGVVSEIRDPGLYALKVTGDDMLPTYRKGDVMIVSPAARVQKGDRVVARLRDGEVTVRELVNRSSSEIEWATLDAAHATTRMETSEALWMARILWVSQ